MAVTKLKVGDRVTFNSRQYGGKVISVFGTIRQIAGTIARINTNEGAMISVEISRLKLVSSVGGV